MLRNSIMRIIQSQFTNQRIHQVWKKTKKQSRSLIKMVISINQGETTTTITLTTTIIIIVVAINQLTTRQQPVVLVVTVASKINSTLINMHMLTHTIKRLKMTTNILITTMGSSKVANTILLLSSLGRKANSFRRMSLSSQKTMKKKRSL